MHPTHRAKYNDPNTPEDQRNTIFQTYKDKLEERKSREAAEFRRRLARIAEAQDWLQTIKDDPKKAHIRRPADDSEEELLKWHEYISKPAPNSVPHPKGSERPTVARPQNISLSVEENLRTPQEITLQLQDDLHKMGDAVSSPVSNSNDKPWHKRGDLVLAVVLALGAAVLGIAVILLPPTSVKAVIFWLTILFSLLAAAEILVARYREWSWFKTIAGIVLMLLIVVVFGWFAWPEPRPQASVEKPQTEVKALPPPESVTNTTPLSNSNARPKRILYTIQGQDADLTGAEVSAYNEHSEYTFKGYIETKGEIRIKDLPGGLYVIIVSHPKFGRFHGQAIIPLEGIGKGLPIVDADATVRLERWVP